MAGSVLAGEQLHGGLAQARGARDQRVAAAGQPVVLGDGFVAATEVRQGLGGVQAGRLPRGRVGIGIGRGHELRQRGLVLGLQRRIGAGQLSARTGRVVGRARRGRRRLHAALVDDHGFGQQGARLAVDAALPRVVGQHTPADDDDGREAADHRDAVLLEPGLGGAHGVDELVFLEVMSLGSFHDRSRGLRNPGASAGLSRRSLRGDTGARAGNCN